MRIASHRPATHPSAHPPALNARQKELQRSLTGTLPTVLTDAQAKLLKSPAAHGAGGDKGTLSLTYRFKDAAAAKAMARALNDGWDGLYENTNEGLDTVGMTDMKIRAVGNTVVVDAAYAVGA